MTHTIRIHRDHQGKVPWLLGSVTPRVVQDDPVDEEYRLVSTDSPSVYAHWLQELTKNGVPFEPVT